jgi:hypothetical protein
MKGIRTSGKNPPQEIQVKQEDKLISMMNKDTELSP